MEFSNPPGRHEREWRHPSEVAAEQRAAFQRTSAPVGIILATVGGVGALVASLTVLIAFAVAAPYRPDSPVPASPVQRVCVPRESSACVMASESIGTVAPAGDADILTSAVTGSTVATTTSSTLVAVSGVVANPLP